MRLLSVVLVSVLASGCVSTRTEKRSQKLRVNTEPEGATVWLKDASGQRFMGPGPANLEQSYDVAISDFNEWSWLGVAAAALGAAGGTALVVSAQSNDSDAPTEGQLAGGIGLLAAGGVGLVLGLIYCIKGQSREGEERLEIQNIEIGAELAGHLTRKVDLTVPGDQKEVSLVLPRVEAPVAGPGPRKVIVAVFDVQDTAGIIGEQDVVSLTNYLGSALAQKGEYKIVPRDQLRARLFEEKKGTYRQCYQESCQIELGKALAAQKTLATTLIRVGSKCAVTANLFDLKTETAEKGATVNTGCSPDALLDAMKQLAGELSK